MTTGALSRQITSMELVHASGASYRQVDHWTRCGYLVPDVPAHGSGSQRLFTATEAVLARLLVTWWKTGQYDAAIKQLKPAVPFIREAIWDGEPMVTIQMGPYARLVVDLAALRRDTAAALAPLAVSA